MKRWIFAPLLCAMACQQQPLIEGASLNRGQLHDIVDRASSASGLRVITPVSVQLVTRRELHDLLKQEADAELHSDERRSAEAAMGLRSAPSDVGIGLLSRVTTGLYLRSRRTLFLVTEPARGRDGSIHLSSFGELDDEVTLAHEVVHALQHQHFPHLFDRSAFSENQADAAAALQAAIEGAATFAAAKTLGFMGAPRDPDEVISDPLPSGPLEDEHPLVREQLSFPYTYGYRIAYFEGTRLLESPPVSTEQVIHLGDRGRRVFLAIDLSNLTKALQEQGCRELSEDTMGELGISLWLRNAHPGTDPSTAEGWDGDRWIALKCAGTTQIAWLTSWDTQEDAIEFESAIEAIVEEQQQRGESSPRWTSNRNGHEVVVTSNRLPIDHGRIRELARRARIATREELVAHFRRMD